LTPYLCPAIKNTTLVYCVPPLLDNAQFSMAHDLIARRFLWQPQLLTRVSSPPGGRGCHEAMRFRAEDVSEVLVCYSLGVYETQSNPQATRVIA